jgi:hypothetical protein
MIIILPLFCESYKCTYNFSDLNPLKSQTFKFVLPKNKAYIKKCLEEPGGPQIHFN